MRLATYSGPIHSHLLKMTDNASEHGESVLLANPRHLGLYYLTRISRRSPILHARLTVFESALTLVISPAASFYNTRAQQPHPGRLTRRVSRASPSPGRRVSRLDRPGCLRRQKGQLGYEQ